MKFSGELQEPFKRWVTPIFERRQGIKFITLLHSEKCISQRQTSSRVWGVKYVLIGETIEKHSKYPTYRKPLSTIGHQDRFQFGEKSDLPMFTFSQLRNPDKSGSLRLVLKQRMWHPINRKIRS